MATAVRVGILGGGNWTRTVHLPNLARIPAVEVVAVSTSDPERRERLRAAWRQPVSVCETPEEVLARDDLDAVIVCTPNDTHETLSIATLRSGRHVLCEKPAALTTAGVDRIARAVAETGRVFQVDLELGYSDVVTAMRRAIAAGHIGEPRLLSCLLLRDWGAFRGWRGDPVRSGGMFLELGIHYLDLFNLLAGGQPVLVTAAGGHASGADLPDYLSATVTYDNGAVGQLGLTVLAAARNEIQLQVIGTEARLDGEIISGRLELWRRRTSAPENLSPSRASDYRFDGFPGSQEALAGWVECIVQGVSPPAGPAAARAATAVSAAAEVALRYGRAERVDPV